MALSYSPDVADPAGDARSELGPIGTVLAASALVASLTAPVLRRGNGGGPSPNVLTRIVEQVVPAVLDSIDLNAVLERVDMDALLDRVDIDELIGRVDVDEVVARIDLGALLDRIDLNQLVGRIDLNSLLDNVDLDGVLERIDVAGIAKRAEIGELVAESTTSVVGSVLDLVRRQLVGLDLIANRVVNRTLHRDVHDLQPGPTALVAPDVSAGAAG